jgi:ribosomal protein L28
MISLHALFNLSQLKGHVTFSHHSSVHHQLFFIWNQWNNFNKNGEDHLLCSTFQNVFDDPANYPTWLCKEIIPFKSTSRDHSTQIYVKRSFQPNLRQEIIPLKSTSRDHSNQIYVKRSFQPNLRQEIISTKSTSRDHSNQIYFTLVVFEDQFNHITKLLMTWTLSDC